MNMSTNLYELTGEMLQLQDLLMDPDIDPQLIEDTIESLDFDYEKKLEGYAKIIKNFEALTEASKKEEERIKERRKYFETQIESMKKRIKDSMLVLNKKQVRTTIFLFSIKQGQPKLCIDNENKIPEKYLNPQPAKIKSKELKEFLKNNGDTSYAHLVDGEPTLQIK